MACERERTAQRRIQRVCGDDVSSLNDVLVQEARVSIAVNGNRLVESSCSPGDLETWALGYLLSEGWIETADEAREIRVEGGRVTIDLDRETPCELQSASSDQTFSLAFVQKTMGLLTRGASLFERTGATHAVALATEDGSHVFAEDVSRTCALERAIGEASNAGLPLDHMLAVLTSRLPERMVEKLALCGVPVVAGVSAPTVQAVELADRMRVGLIGFARGDRLNVYTHGWRVGL